MEFWDLYDEKRNVTGLKHKRCDELPNNFYHLVVHVWIQNKNGEYLISQRSEHRKNNPLMFECVGGSVLFGETSKEGALRETIEEVGINLKDCEGKVIYSKTRGFVEGQKFNDIMDVWLFEYNGDVNLKNATTDEVCDSKWMTIDEIKELFLNGKLVPTLEYIFDLHEKQKTQKANEKINKIKKNSKKLAYNKQKNKYFDFYNDIKDGSHKIVDW